MIPLTRFLDLWLDGQKDAVQVYAHVLPSSRQQAAAVIGRFLDGGSKVAVNALTTGG